MGGEGGRPLPLDLQNFVKDITPKRNKEKEEYMKNNLCETKLQPLSSPYCLMLHVRVVSAPPRLHLYIDNDIDLPSRFLIQFHIMRLSIASVR